MALSPASKPQRPQVVLETPRLILRAATESDLDDLHECFSDNEVMRYWDSLPFQTVERTKEELAKILRSDRNGVTNFVYCLKLTEEQMTAGASGGDRTMEVLGKVGVWRDNEIGFLLKRKWWGHGFAYEAGCAVLDHVFLGLDNDTHPSDDIKSPEDIVADVDPRNIASLGILKKFGFEEYDFKEKTFLVGDAWVDSVYLRLTRNDWVKRTTKAD